MSALWVPPVFVTSTRLGLSGRFGGFSPTRGVVVAKQASRLREAFRQRREGQRERTPSTSWSSASQSCAGAADFSNGAVERYVCKRRSRPLASWRSTLEGGGRSA